MIALLSMMLLTLLTMVATLTRGYILPDTSATYKTASKGNATMRIDIMPEDVEQIEGESLDDWWIRKDAWEKLNKPNYYVHPKHWYKGHPGECGQGYANAVSNYHVRIKERQEERLEALKPKVPFIVGSVVIGGVIGIVGYKVLKR